MPGLLKSLNIMVVIISGFTVSIGGSPGYSVYFRYNREKFWMVGRYNASQT